MLSSVASGVSEVGVAQALVAGVESLDAEPVARRHRDSRILVSRAWRSLAAAWWVATEVAVFGVFGLVWLAATYAIVERRPHRSRG